MQKDTTISIVLENYPADLISVSCNKCKESEIYCKRSRMPKVVSEFDVRQIIAFEDAIDKDDLEQIINDGHLCTVLKRRDNTAEHNLRRFWRSSMR